MACIDVLRARKQKMLMQQEPEEASPKTLKKPERLFFGVDAYFNTESILQNNSKLFDWVVKNKVTPDFFGRNINGENSLTVEEINYIHSKGCRIAPIYKSEELYETNESGINVGQKIIAALTELNVPSGTAVFLRIYEYNAAKTDFLIGYSHQLLDAGFTPAFMANTDARFGFDEEFSRAYQVERELIGQSLIWATSPVVDDYNKMTTTHLVYPDLWRPFAPSAITRNDIAIWQYGKECHKIYDDSGNETWFNLDLVSNEEIIINKMF